MKRHDRYYRAVWLILALAIPAGASASPEYIESERQAAGSVQNSADSLDHALRGKKLRRHFEALGRTLREGTLLLHPRNYYFHQRSDGQASREAWAQGGWLSYDTPWWKDRLRLGTTLYTSQKLYGPADKDGSGLLQPGQQSYTVLGQLYLEARLLDGMTLKLYRQALDLPYLNRNDVRMVPNTFEAALLMDTSHEHFAWGIGQVHRMKGRTSDRFVSMTEAAGIKGPDRGVSVAGFRYRLGNGLQLGAFEEYGRDYMNVFYAEANSRTRTLGDWGLQFSAQYTDQRALGDKLDGDFDTRSWGLKAAASHSGIIATVAHVRTAANARIRKPWGGSPSYLSLMISDFDRADENGWRLGLSTDFSGLDLKGASAFINYARGDTPEHGRNASPDQSELDFTVDYRFPGGPARGLWLRLRAAFLEQDGDEGNDDRQLRVIVNYDFPVF
ncbi:MAG TPA: outer membrane porin, OprD family [Gammaproteobacteria bacterium]|nr:outer membrane porin, OprD family [Gammaproteobacteria bacterium]